MKTDFLTNIEKGKIKPIAADALEHLFAAYKYEEFGLFKDAVKEYDLAIAKRCSIMKMYIQGAHSLVKWLIDNIH